MACSFVFLCYFCLAGVSGTDTVKEVSVVEGESVTLHSDVTEVQRNVEIQWRFGAGEALIANIDKNHISLKDGPDGRFKNRLLLDPQTGSLTINNITKTHSGPYQLTIKTGEIEFYPKFSLTVSSRLPVPFINVSSVSFSSSSQSNSSVVCSVVSVSAVSLSWYKGNSLLSSISVSDLSISVSLPLEVECQEKNTYSCIINNTVSNQTTHLDINKVCQSNEGSPDSLTLIMLLSAAAAAGSLLILALLVIICYCRNNRKKRKAETHTEVITYADPTFHKRRAPKPRVQEEPDVIYAGVAVRR